MFVFYAVAVWGFIWGLFGKYIMSLKDDFPTVVGFFQFIPAGIMLYGLIYGMFFK